MIEYMKQQYVIKSPRVISWHCFWPGSAADGLIAFTLFRKTLEAMLFKLHMIDTCAWYNLQTAMLVTSGQGHAATDVPKIPFPR